MSPIQTVSSSSFECVRRVCADGLYLLSLLYISLGRFLAFALFSCVRFVFLFFKCDVLSTRARVFWLRSLWAGFYWCHRRVGAFTSFVSCRVLCFFLGQWRILRCRSPSPCARTWLNASLPRQCLCVFCVCGLRHVYFVRIFTVTSSARAQCFGGDCRRRPLHSASVQAASAIIKVA